MLKIRRGDIVQAVKGKDAGKKGKVLKVFLAEGKALVEGLNLLKKHKRKTRQDQQGGIVTIESKISLANLRLVCKQCAKPARVGFKILADKTKSRFCKACGEII
jgi:large subunit ribosomal protein L24